VFLLRITGLNELDLIVRQDAGEVVLRRCDGVGGAPLRVGAVVQDRAPASPGAAELDDGHVQPVGVEYTEGERRREDPRRVLAEGPAHDLVLARSDRERPDGVAGNDVHPEAVQARGLLEPIPNDDVDSVGERRDL